MDKHDPIAVFDSGLGGISVLRQLLRIMPQENYIYFGDSLNAPYGPRSKEDVCRLTVKNVDFLLQKKAKAIVLACNTATAAACKMLRSNNPDIPIIGIEPAIKPAVTGKKGGRILVMATAMTLSASKFAKLLAAYKDQAQLLLLPAPGIVELVEAGITGGSQLDDYLDQLLAPYRYPPIDGIVLGCTHFPLVQDSIIRSLGYPAAIFDGAEGTARETKRQLAARGWLNECSKKGQVEFCNSNPDPALNELCLKLLNS